MKLKVKISPNAKKNEIIGWFGDQLKIKISAVPEKGKANVELVNFLSEKLEIPKDFIEIIAGHTSSSKFLEIKGICLEDLENKLDLKKIQEKLI